MKRTSEVAEIEAALKRGAYKAVHGTREERSGRFLPAGRRNAVSADRVSKHPDRSRRKA